MDSEKTKADFLISMGKRMKQQRKAKKITQYQLAELMDVTPQMISSAELGQKAIRPENLAKMAKILDVSADYLLTGEFSDTDIRRLRDKLSVFGYEQLQQVEQILDACIQLCTKTDANTQITQK